MKLPFSDPDYDPAEHDPWVEQEREEALAREVRAEELDDVGDGDPSDDVTSDEHDSWLTPNNLLHLISGLFGVCVFIEIHAIQEEGGFGASIASIGGNSALAAGMHLFGKRASKHPEVALVGASVLYAVAAVGQVLVNGKKYGTISAIIDIVIVLALAGAWLKRESSGVANWREAAVFGAPVGAAIGFGSVLLRWLFKWLSW